MLRATTNHIYRLDELLGRGVSCNVYKGIDKTSGEEHALKIFNVALPAYHNEALRREISALKTLGHPNVVNFLGLERESNSGHQVLVMELCTAGTLVTVLSEPQHTQGLSEDEFLLFFRHIVAGLRHLRSNGFVHRDIKPGNILRNIGEDGKSVYKLSDFGSARQFGEGEENFMSMHGTEEYLHPDIFEKAFMNRAVEKVFTPSVDVWSIAATVYHAITGTIPFRPFGGRKNKETMFEMISRKESGVISGVQTSPDGEITWSRELPSTCTLSRKLKAILTKICAGMLEKNSSRMWSFDTFFFETERLFDKIRVFVFYVHDCTSEVLYLEKTDTLSQLQREVSNQTSAFYEHVSLYWNEKPLSEGVSADTEIRDYPRTTDNRPIIVVPAFSTSMEVQMLPHIGMEAFPGMPVTSQAIEEDYRQTKIFLEILFQTKKKMDECRRSQELLLSTASSVRTQMISSANRLVERTRKECTVVDHLQMSVGFAQNLFKKTSHEEKVDRHSYDFGDDGPNKDNLREGFAEIEDVLTQSREKLQGIKHRSEEILGEAGSYTTDEKALSVFFNLDTICRCECECVTKTKLQMSELKTLIQKFEARRRVGRLPYHEEQLHTFDRRHVSDICSKITTLWDDHCWPAIQRVFKSFVTLHGAYRGKMTFLTNSLVSVKGIEKEVQHLQHQYQKLQGDLSSRYRLASPTTQSCAQSVVTEREKRHRRHDVCKALETRLSESSGESMSLKDEMDSLQESLNSMVETLQLTEEPEKLSFDEMME